MFIPGNAVGYWLVFWYPTKMRVRPCICNCSEWFLQKVLTSAKMSLSAASIPSSPYAKSHRDTSMQAPRHKGQTGGLGGYVHQQKIMHALYKYFISQKVVKKTRKMSRMIMDIKCQWHLPPHHQRPPCGACGTHQCGKKRVCKGPKVDV